MQIQRLINPVKRIVFSNIYPSTSNTKILKALENNNIILVLPINYLKTGVNITGYEHIMSCRQIFLKPENIS